VDYLFGCTSVICTSTGCDTWTIGSGTGTRATSTF